MAATRVGIIGCGIAGPVLATFLKLKGYDPIVYEQHKSADGASLALRYDSSFCNDTQAHTIMRQCTTKSA